jgi:hypothetical protein
MLFPPLAACSDSATLSAGQKIVVVYQNVDRYEGEAETHKKRQGKVLLERRFLL